MAEKVLVAGCAAAETGLLTMLEHLLLLQPGAHRLLHPDKVVERLAVPPLVAHAGFAVGCVLLQQIMARHAPGGILSTRVVRTLPLVLERSLMGG